MTGSDLATLAASAAAVAALVALCWAIGFRTSVQVADDAALRALVRAEAPEAEVVAVARDVRGESGLAALSDGRIVAVRSMGDRFAARTLGAREYRIARLSGDRVRVSIDDPGFPPVVLRLGGQDLPDAFAPRTSATR